MKSCEVAGCPSLATKRGWCAFHYGRWRRLGDPSAGGPRRALHGEFVECIVEGCTGQAFAKHLCGKHYAKLRKYGTPTGGRQYGQSNESPPVTPKRPKVRQPCGVDGCTDPAKKRGWCLFHYGRWRQFGDPASGGPRRLPPNSLAVCCIDGCGKPAIGKHYCSKHFAKLKKYGSPHGGWEQDGRSKEWHIRKGGYVMRYDPTSPHANRASGIVFQHRQVMGELIGRPLLSTESVHHKNGERSDNRVDNLELWVKGQPAGQRIQDQVTLAREILRQYGDLVDRMT